MKKFCKAMIASAMALGLVFTGVLAGCDKDGDKDKDTPEETKITDGRWENKKAEVFLKLNEDGTFYVSGMFANNAGTYEIVDESVDYYKIEAGATPETSSDEEDYPGTTIDETKYTASQKLVMTAYNGAVYTAAYAEDTFWNCLIPTPQGTMSRTMRQNASYEWSEEDEESIQILSVCTAKDANRNLVLNHDKTFEDQINGYTEGTWEQSAQGYVLKNAQGNEHASVTAVVDGKCTYTPANGTAIELYTEAWTPVSTLMGTAQATMKGENEAEEVTVTLNLWQDKTADVVVLDPSYQSHTVLSGTYELKTDETAELTFGETKSTISAPNQQGNSEVSLEIAAGELFENSFSVTLSGKLSVAVKEVARFATEEDVTASGIPGVNTAETPVVAVMYSDNTAELKVSIFGNEVIVDRGTYVLDTTGQLPSITFTFENAGEIKAAPDYSTASPTGITFDLTYTAEEVEVSALGNTFGISFTATMRYAYVTA